MRLYGLAALGFHIAIAVFILRPLPIPTPCMRINIDIAANLALVTAKLFLTTTGKERGRAMLASLVNHNVTHQNLPAGCTPTE